MSKIESVLNDEAKDVPRCSECKSDSVYITQSAMYCQNCGHVDELEQLIMEE